MTKAKATKGKAARMTRKEFDELPDDKLPYQARCWDWVLHNPTPEEIEHIQKEACVFYRYCLYGQELCPTTGGLHLQGMVVFPNGKTRAGVVSALGPRISCRQLYSSEERLADYCAKDGITWENDPLRRPVSQEDNGLKGAARTKDILRLAKAGLFDELEATYPDAWFYQQRAIMSARGHIIKNNVPLDGILDNYWIYGEPGTGKGQYVDSLTDNYYTKAADEKWWCGFDGQPDVLMDDLGRGIVPLLGKFKLWTDRKPFNAEVKGGNWLIRPKRTFITSHWHPRDIIDNPKDLASITRRFQIIEIKDEKALWYPRENIIRPKLAVRVDVVM